MKNSLLIILILTISLNVYSKDRYVMAQIIKNNNDTVVSPILYKKLFDFQESIILKNDDGSKTTLFPKDVKGFHVLTGSSDTLFFESNCGLKFGLSSSIDDNCYFMLKIRAGIIPLYYFANKKFYSIGVTMKTDYAPCYLTQYRYEWIMMEENNFRDQFIKIIKPFKHNANALTLKKLVELEDKFKLLKYRFDDVPKGIDSLNALLIAEPKK